MNIRRYIIRNVTRLSLLLYLYRLSNKFVKLKSLFQFQRFRLLTKTQGSICIDTPFYVCGHQYIKIGKGFNSRAGLRMECLDVCELIGHAPQLIIGNEVSMNFRCHIGVVNQVPIGNDVLIGSNVLITDHSHGFNDERDVMQSSGARVLYSKGPVVIEDRVWIGENACILPGVTVGHHSVIGANTVVTHDVLPYCVVAGSPANSTTDKNEY